MLARLSNHLFVLFAVAAMLASCRVRDSGQQQLVVPELVRSHLYVAPGGSDSHPGTRSEPLRTLTRAAQLATPGTTVHVAPGSYSGGVRTTINGTAEARIVFQSTERGAARIVPPLDARQSAAWDNRANHIDIIGFEIDGSAYQSGMKWVSGIYNGGSYNRILDNTIHHIGNDVPCDTKGGAGIGVDSYYRGTAVEVIGNTVHDIGPAQCRYMHGIYVSTRASVRNNVIYRVAGAGIHLWHDATHVTVRGNTVAGAGVGIVVGGGDFYHHTGPNDHTSVTHNIVVGNTLGIIEQGKTGPNNTFADNLVYDNQEDDWRLAPGRRHSGTVNAAPRFINGDLAGTPDFHLRPDSPAVGKASGPAQSEAAPLMGALPAGLPQTGAARPHGID